MCVHGIKTGPFVSCQSGATQIQALQYNVKDAWLRVAEPVSLNERSDIFNRNDTEKARMYT